MEIIRPAIYTIKNNVNGKQYKGKTVHGVEKRLAEHQRDAKPNRGIQSYFYKAIRKHGADKFYIPGWLELGPGFTEDKTPKQIDEALNALEIISIRLSESNNPAKGYNGTLGGDGSTGHIHSAETRKKISEAGMGRQVSVETRLKQSKIFKGRVISPKWAAKISVSLTGVKLSPKHSAKMGASRLGVSLPKRQAIWSPENSSEIIRLYEKEFRPRRWIARKFNTRWGVG